MARNEDVTLALIFGIGGSVLGYWKGRDDGYTHAKSEDTPYMRALERENSRLQHQNSQLTVDLLQERRRNAQLREELERSTIRPRIQKAS